MTSIINVMEYLHVVWLHRARNAKKFTVWIWKEIER
jgi:hypothetical protein